MDHQLRLTAKGIAVCELMADLGLTLEAACTRIDGELEALRERVDTILTDSDSRDMPRAVEAALESVSLTVQNAYLEEASAVPDVPARHRDLRHLGAFIH